MSDVRVSGAVKFFDATKGWGFIRTSDGDVFVHASELQKANIGSLAEGQSLTFEMQSHPKGRRAVKLELKH